MEFNYKITNIYVSLILLGLPLVFTDHYFNITFTKYAFFSLISLFFIIFYVVYSLLEKIKIKDITKTDRCLLLFVLIVLLSSLFSGYECWIGSYSRYQGFFTILLYAALFLIISKSKIEYTYVIKPIVIALSFVSVLATLNMFNIDVFLMFKNIAEDSIKNFTSTIGNIDFYSSYLSLMFPVVYVDYCKRKDHKSMIPVLLAGIGIMSCGSDSVILGLGAAIMVMYYFLLNDRKAFIRFHQCNILLCMIGVIYAFILNRVDHHYSFNLVMKVFSKPILGIGIIVLMIILYFVYAKMMLVNFQKMYRNVVIVALLALIAVLAYINIAQIDCGKYNSYLVFSDTWGHNRGKTWMYCMDSFLHDYSLKDRLLGVGPDCLRYVTMKTDIFALEMNAAHNEFLNYLMCIGILGLVSYVGFVVKVIRDGVLKIKENPISLGILSGIVGYLACSIVNIAQPNTTPFLFIFLALMYSIKKIES